MRRAYEKRAEQLVFGAPIKRFIDVRSGGRGGLLQLALHLERACRELLVAGLEQPVVEPAVVLDRAQAVGRNAELEAAVERLAHQRNVLQIGQKRLLGLVVGVAHIVADLTALAGEFADAGHDKSLRKNGFGGAGKGARIPRGSRIVKRIPRRGR
jgi:hypothetical protein